MTTCGIYAIFELGGDCLYVGQSRDIERRWKRHLSSLRSGRHRRLDFIEWFSGQEDASTKMKFQIVEELDSESTDEELNLREIHWFDLLKPRFYGKLPSVKETWQHSEETKHKIREGMNKTFSKRSLKKNLVLNLVCERCGKEFTNIGKPLKLCSRNCGSFRSRLTPELKIELLEQSKIKSLRQMAPEYGVSYVALHHIIKEIEKDNPV